MDVYETSASEKGARDAAASATHHDGEVGTRTELVDDSLGVSVDVGRDLTSDTVTLKTWVVIAVLCLVYGLAWWPIPVTIIMQGYIATQLGDPEALYWFVSIYAAMIAVGFLVAGPNSDLFGRRLILLIGGVCLGVGLILPASAKTVTEFQAGMGIAGFGAGVLFMILCSVRELLPKKYRHIGLGLAEAMGFVTVVIGPITARLATVDGGNTWRWLYWADFILLVVSLALMAWLYHPPKHPRGVPWHEALVGFDWLGLMLGSAGLAPILTGIIYTSYLPASDLRVVLPLSIGFPVLVVFGFVKYKVCPPELFKANYGCDFSAPIVVAAITYMYYFGINVIYPTMVVQLWTMPSTSLSEQLALTTPSNLGLCTGLVIMLTMASWFSKLIGFRWALIIDFGLMLLFGGLMTLVTPFNKSLMIAVTFLQQVCYAYAVNTTIALTLWGLQRKDLGIATGLAGTSRNVAGSLSQAIYTTILVNTQTHRASQTLPQAAIQASLSATNAAQLLQVWPLGQAAREAVPGVNAKILGAADLAWKWSYAHGLRSVGLASLGFGLTGWLTMFACIDPEPRMTDQIEVFLENDVQAEKNEFH